VVKSKDIVKLDDIVPQRKHGFSSGTLKAQQRTGSNIFWLTKQNHYLYNGKKSFVKHHKTTFCDATFF
jgi:hypothetical protein